MPLVKHRLVVLSSQQRGEVAVCSIVSGPTTSSGMRDHTVALDLDSFRGVVVSP